MYLCSSDCLGPKPNDNIVKILIEAGCEINTKNENGFSAIMLCQNIYIVQMLMDANCEFTIEDYSKIRNRKPEILDKLKQYLQDQYVKKYIRKTNYLNVIKHIPIMTNEFKYKFSSIGQKITKYNLQLKMITKEQLYELIKENEPAILDYLTIISPDDLFKLEDYICV